MKDRKIPTLEEYLNEDFFNPFDEEDKKKAEKKPKKMVDNGGRLIKSGEHFNIGRIEFVKRPAGGYTVKAKTQFARGETVEVSPVIILPEAAKTVQRLKDIIFEINKEKGHWGLVLGYGSLYKHSQNPNVEYAYNKKTRRMHFITKRPVNVGEELTIDYGKNYWEDRTEFNTMANIDVEEELKKLDIEESEVQPNVRDIQGTQSMKTISDPKNRNNPVYSGRAIRGAGQS
jgi:hypothetical protein